MKQWRIFLIIIIISNSSFAQAKKINAFIPEDYDTLGVAKGDLNKDKIEDYVMALYHTLEKDETKDMDSIPSRLLVILLGTKDGYLQSAKSSNALLCRHCGGVFGDPYAGIEIANNVLKIYHYGGSAWRWSYTHKFRFQNNNLYLIGKTMNSYWNVKHCDRLADFAGTENEDINFVTGDYQIKKISENCKLLVNKKGKKKIQPLVAFNKFSIEQ